MLGPKLVARQSRRSGRLGRFGGHNKLAVDPRCGAATAEEHTGRAVIGHGTTARHTAHNTARPHSTRPHSTAPHSLATTRAQRHSEMRGLPAVPSRLPTQTSTRSAAHDATDHARADVGATLLTRAHSQTNPSTISHISRCAGLCAQQPHGEWHARPPQSTRTSEGTGEALSGIDASGAHSSGAKFGKRLASLLSRGLSFGSDSLRSDLTRFQVRYHASIFMR